MKTTLPNRYRKLYKLSILLQQIKEGKKKVGFIQWQALVKKFQRALRKATLSLAPAAKACSVFALSVLLSKGVAAQCNRFNNADAINPLHIQNSPGNRAPYFVDIDGDGDLDCYVQDFYYDYGTPKLLRNVGTKQFPVYKYEADSSGFDGINLDLPTSKEQFVDIDGDGDYDCFIAEGYPIGGTFETLRIKYFENVGTAKQPKFVENEAKNILGFAGGIYTVDFTFADIDGDGDLDVHIVSDFYDETFLNTGTKTKPQLTEFSYDSFFNVSSHTYYDWNHDGLLDYFNYLGQYFKNIGPKDAPQYVEDDADAPQFRNYAPIWFTDLHDDGQPDAFNEEGGYSTLSPIPKIDSTHETYRHRNYVQLAVSPRGRFYTYQWYRNDVKIARATSPSLIAVKSGTYIATVTDSCGTGYSLPLSVQVDTTRSNVMIADDRLSDGFVNAKAISVTSYPNPFANTITVQLPASLPGAMLQVTDMQGKVLIHEQVSGNMVMLGSQLAAGVYLLQVVANHTVVYTQKIIKE